MECEVAEYDAAEAVECEVADASEPEALDCTATEVSTFEVAEGASAAIDSSDEPAAEVETAQSDE